MTDFVSGTGPGYIIHARYGSALDARHAEVARTRRTNGVRLIWVETERVGMTSRSGGSRWTSRQPPHRRRASRSARPPRACRVCQGTA